MPTFSYYGLLSAVISMVFMLFEKSPKCPLVLSSVGRWLHNINLLQNLTLAWVKILQTLSRLLTEICLDWLSRYSKWKPTSFFFIWIVITIGESIAHIDQFYTLSRFCADKFTWPTWQCYWCFICWNWNWTISKPIF